MADDNRRFPPNLQGLLRFCSENTRQEDAPGTTGMQPMSEERRKFLEEVLAAMAGNDPTKRMLENINLLLQPSSSADEKETALEDLKEYCEDIDLANDFFQIGGCFMLSRLLQHESSELQWRTGDLIATLTQNNPRGQQAILEADLMPVLLAKVDCEKEPEIVRIKCLYALSCLVRSNSESKDKFLQLDGFSHLLRAMQTDIDKLRIKATFLLSSLCLDYHDTKDVLCDMGMVEQLVALLHTEYNSEFHEQLMVALLTLITDHPRAQNECHRPEFKLSQLLTQKIQFFNGKPEHQEEIEYAHQLMQILDLKSCSPSSTASSSVMDR